MRWSNVGEVFVISLSATHRAVEATYAVTGVPVPLVQAPLDESIDNKIADRCCHVYHSPELRKPHEVGYRMAGVVAVLTMRLIRTFTSRFDKAQMLINSQSAEIWWDAVPSRFGEARSLNHTTSRCSDRKVLHSRPLLPGQNEKRRHRRSLAFDASRSLIGRRFACCLSCQPNRAMYCLFNGRPLTDFDLTVL